MEHSVSKGNNQGTKKNGIPAALKRGQNTKTSQNRSRFPTRIRVCEIFKKISNFFFHCNTVHTDNAYSVLVCLLKRNTHENDTLAPQKTRGRRAGDTTRGLSVYPVGSGVWQKALLTSMVLRNNPAVQTIARKALKIVMRTVGAYRLSETESAGWRSPRSTTRTL